MYRRPRFLVELHAIQEEMSRECDYDVELFAEMIRRGSPPTHGPIRVIRGQRVATPGRNQVSDKNIKPNQNDPKKN